MVTNLKHLSEGKVRITFKAGHRVACRLLQNDQRAAMLRVEIEEGFFAQVPYEDVAHASVPLNQ